MNKNLDGNHFYKLIKVRFADLKTLLNNLNVNSKTLNSDIGLYRIVVPLISFYAGRLYEASCATELYKGTTLHRIRTIMSQLNSLKISHLIINTTPDERDWKARSFCYKFLNQLGRR